MMNLKLKNSITEASKVIGKTWPLYAFVTSNPLSGYEKSTFEVALKSAAKNLGSSTLPAASMYRQALENGEIDKKVLLSLLAEKSFNQNPEYYLQQMEAEKIMQQKNKNHNLDRIMSKWLAVFMDEGSAEWEMPNKSEGFFTAWRKLAKYDKEISANAKADIPKTVELTLAYILKDYSEKDYLEIFKYHIAALPGWTGYIKYRKEENSAWQQKYPISLEDYLAVRLWIAKSINAELLPSTDIMQEKTPSLALKYLWLKAWEKTWQNQLTKTLIENSNNLKGRANSKKIPDAQLVFCIDTRSELIRRHIEANGNYETFGYAGFFGIAMDYKNPDSGLIRKSCPPILSSAYIVSEVAQKGKESDLLAYQQKTENIKFSKYFFKRLKNMLPSAFGYVEGSGLFYGVSLTARTIFPAYASNFRIKNKQSHEGICETEINDSNNNKETHGITLKEKVNIVKSAVDLLGIENFAQLVIFAGHASQSANNAFKSSLDCGACAASPGRHNARMLAKIANEEIVRIALNDDYGIYIPEDTFFIGAEHNTATDEIVLFDNQVPKTHLKLIENLKSDFINVQKTATQERFGYKKDSIKIAHKKANNWAETRPEWGLAKNAAFIIGPRNITKDIHLDGRCFLHSYNWELDKNGKALEGIMQGPMVVTHWINSHYYFSTVNNEQFGGGSKITQNVTGKLGVVQGNGGDLKIGLPLQSIKSSDKEMYHQPLRLTVVIQAPMTRVADIIERNEYIKTLLDNEWLYLMVMDPLHSNQMRSYHNNWELENETIIEPTSLKAAKKPISVLL
jgi:uncharacterized protein YbcC (UPF0753/DUF2309 family)